MLAAPFRLLSSSETTTPTRICSPATCSKGTIWRRFRRDKGGGAADRHSVNYTFIAMLAGAGGLSFVK